MDEEFVPLDPMGVLAASATESAKPAEAPAPEAPAAAPGLAAEAPRQLADRAAPGLAAADEPAAGAPMQKRTLMGYARDQEEARQRPENLVELTNTGATRNLPITDALRSNIQNAITTVYGPGYRAQVYSGGQPEIGSGGARVGSTRHDGGHAGDVYVIGPDGKRVTGDALAPLAKHWIGNKLGGVGLEMRGGGIHLDSHTDRPAAWSYGALSPAQQAVINEARGTIPGGGAVAGADRSGIPSSYYASIRAAESSGNDAARNPASSATGRYQFTEGTWKDLMRAQPQLGLTPDGRLNPDQQERAIRAFTEQNASALRRAGIPINNGTLYAAHFLGAGGAIKALSADPSARMSEVADPDAVAANPFLANMTVGQFQQWAGQKAGGGGTALASAAPGAAGAAPPPGPRVLPSETLDQNTASPPEQVASAVTGLARRARPAETPGLAGSGPRQQSRSPNALGLDGAADAELAELDAEIAVQQQAAFRDPRAAAALAQLQQRRATLSSMS